MPKTLFLVTMRAGSHFIGQLLSGIPNRNIEEKLDESWVVTKPEKICPLYLPCNSLGPDALLPTRFPFECWVSYVADGPPSPDIFPFHGMAMTQDDVRHLGDGWTIIHSIRDGRNQIASNKTLDEQAQKWTVDRFVGRCHAFKYRARNALAASQLPNYKIIKFEDFAAHPLESLMKVITFTGIPIDLEYIKQILPRLEPRTSFVDQPLRVTERWKVLSRDERTLLHQIAGAELIELGYVQDDSWVNE